MNLNQLFDVVRGFNPEGSGPSIPESFVPKATLSNSVAALVPGHVVYIYSDGTVDVATTPNMSSASPVGVWMVVMANDFDNTFTGKVVCVRGNVMVKTDVIDTSALVVGSLVSFSAGKLILAASTNQVVGEVVEDNRTAGLADGTITVMFTGGCGRAF